MKRKLAIFLAAVLLLTLPGCKRTAQTSSTAKAETVTAEQMEEKFGIPVVSVMIDLPNDDSGWKAGQLRETLEYLPGFGTSFTTYEEQIPTEGAERENAITRIKTEIMAGKGPDLFLCEQDIYALDGVGYYGMSSGSDPFFTFPEKAMKNRLFLPLDDYIENAEFMEWDKFLPVLVEAGQNEEGQQIIPMSFSFEALYVDREKYGLEDWDRSMSWEEMRESDNPALQYATSSRIHSVVGRVMEPGADEPMFTEEELLGYMRDYVGPLPNEPEYYAGLYEDDTVYTGAMLRALLPNPDITYSSSDMANMFSMGKDSPDYRIIPARNVKGGVTANINEFAAINRNARHPDLAFKIVDYVMSTRNQQESSLFESRVMQGMPVHMDIGSEEFPIDKHWYMSEANFKEYCAARDEITEARFIGPVDKAVWDIDTFDPKNLEKSVHEQYVLIKMLLAES